LLSLWLVNLILGVRDCACNYVVTMPVSNNSIQTGVHQINCNYFHHLSFMMSILAFVDPEETPRDDDAGSVLGEYFVNQK